MNSNLGPTGCGSLLGGYHLTRGLKEILLGAYGRYPQPTPGIPAERRMADQVNVYNRRRGIIESLERLMIEEQDPNIDTEGFAMGRTWPARKHNGERGVDVAGVDESAQDDVTDDNDGGRGPMAAEDNHGEGGVENVRQDEPPQHDGTDGDAGADDRAAVDAPEPVLPAANGEGGVENVRRDEPP